MTVNDLLEMLKALSPAIGNHLVVVRDGRGKLSHYSYTWVGSKCFLIDAFPEPDTNLSEHPFEPSEKGFDISDDDRCCPGPCNGDFNE